jgi:hypothetical protein
LGSNCSGCHSTELFKPAKFDHNNVAFKLTGAHTKVECIKCHSKENKSGKIFQKFKGVAFSSCLDCHKDIHSGKFGKDCKTCHVTTSFKTISKVGFNHDKTNYPLLGKHQLVSCEGCHKNNLGSKPQFQKCINCHTDYHKGDFVVNNEQKDCKECHTVEGYQPSLYSIDSHQKSVFQLTGGHLAVACQSCHYNNESKEWHFRKIGERCIECHKNIHGSELTEKFMKGNDCTVCHITGSWFAINYDHGKTNFKLIGAHARVTCNKCHHGELTNNQYRFVSIKSECLACHKDIHSGQFGGANCENCHGFNNWKAEKLDGAHAKLQCSSCHKKTELNGNVFIKYKLENFKCAACHST